jgi:hypothetical protein
MKKTCLEFVRSNAFSADIPLPDMVLFVLREPLPGQIQALAIPSLEGMFDKDPWTHWCMIGPS